MILDKHLALSEAQVLTATAASTNVVDLGAARQIGLSGGLYALVSVPTALVSAGATTLQVTLQNDSAEAFGSATDLFTSVAIPKATLVAGYQFAIPIPVSGMKRYMRVNYTVATGPFTGGAISCQIIKGLQADNAYPDAL